MAGKDRSDNTHDLQYTTGIINGSLHTEETDDAGFQDEMKNCGATEEECDPLGFAREDLGERKESVAASIYADSGISVNSISQLTDQSEAETEVSHDQKLPRYSLDTSSRRSKFRGKSAHRRSCSLPDILDFERSETGKAGKHNDDGTSSENIYFSAPICGKFHAKEPNYICLKDWEIYCNVCVHVHNFHCGEKVKYIPEIAPEVRTAMCNQTLRDLTSMRERYQRVKSENLVNLEKLKENRKTCMTSILKFKFEILQIIDRVEKEAFHEMDSIYNREKSKIEENIARLESEISILESYRDCFDNNSLSDNTDIIHELQEAIKQCKSGENAIQYLHKSSNVVFFSFEILDRMNTFLNDIPNLWRVRQTEVMACTFPAPCTCEKPYGYRTPVKDHDFSGRHSGWSYDKEKCCFTGSEFLANGYLLLADNSNKKIKMFDKRYKCVSVLSLPSLPWDLAVTEQEMAAVTMPDRKTIQFMSTHQKLTPKHSIHVHKNCWGICHHRDNLIVSCWCREGAEVDIMDINGNVRHVIKTIEGIPFHTPWYVAVNCDVIHVSDWGTFTVPSVTVSGSAVQTYRNRSLQGPLGMTFDPEGNIYICGRDSNNIHQLSPGGAMKQIVLSEKDDVREPLSVCHCPNDDRIVVTSWMSDKISIFKLL